MGKFNWWRRYRPKARLQKKDARKGIPFILQQIDHGDFDHSDLKRQAEEELVRCEKDLNQFLKTCKGNDPKNDSRYLDIERKYRKRYNKLMEDYHEEEVKLLVELRASLIRHFEVDVWEDTLQEAFKRDTTGARDFYFLYNDIVNKQHANTSEEVAS